MRNGSIYEFRFKGQRRRGIYCGTKPNFKGLLCHWFKMPPKGGCPSKENKAIVERWELKGPAVANVSHAIELPSMRSNSGRLVINKYYVAIDGVPLPF